MWAFSEPFTRAKEPLQEMNHLKELIVDLE